MTQERPAPIRSWLKGLAGAAVCLGLGYALGAFATEGRVYREARATGERRHELPSFAEAVERTSPGVVAVRAIVAASEPEQDKPTQPGEPDSALGVRDGSGFVVHARGLVVTARHLAVDAVRLVVDVPDRGPFAAELVGEDEVTDLAVLRLVDAPSGLAPLELGPSEQLRAGDWVVAVGNPYGFRQSVTAGIVSYIGRHLPSDDMRVTSEFLQFSAAVNPGSSGCPIVDLQGRVVGVTTQGAGLAQGLSFAIPSRTLKWALEAMDKSPDGRVHRGRLGISFEANRSGAAAGHGCVVRSVIPGQAAQEAGIQAGDIVLAVDGVPVADSAELHNRITQSAPGSKLRLTVQRDAVQLPDITVTLRETVRDRTELPLAR